MHLLAAQQGTVSDGTEPVDPGQTPADIVVISAADTELAALSEARRALGADAPSLRLMSLGFLQHPMSVDLHLDQCAGKSRLVIARILGGAGYWRYGVEQYAARLGAAGVPFAALPGDDRPDAELQRFSTVAEADCAALTAYLVEGGPENAQNFLRHAAHLLGRGEAPPPARPLLRAGCYWPGQGIADPATLRENWRPGAPVVPVLFYRALLQGAGLQPVNRLVRALMRRGLNPLPVFLASLKDALSVATLEALLADTPPSVVLNATSFAVGAPEAGGAGAPLAQFDVPVLQLVLSTGTEEGWRNGKAGLGPRDIAMNVALPEVDGRLLTRAISFKDRAYFDEATQCAITAYRARGDRVDFVADLAANWARLRTTPAAERRVALVLANYPNRDGRLANGVGLDTPASAVAALRLLREAGYAVSDPPADSADLMARILAGPTNWLTDRAERTGGVRLSLSAYRDAYARLPHDVRAAIEDRWGPPEADPFVTGDAFALSVLEFGSAVIGIQPARGYNIDPKETYHAPDLVPPHNYLAFYIWLRQVFGAHAIVHLGKHGNLEWLPGKAVALSASCFPEAVFGPMPHIYPFIVNDPGEGAQAKRRAQAVIVDHLTPPLTRAESYGPMREIEALLDEYAEAQTLDPRRAEHLAGEILTLAAATGLDRDAGLDRAEDKLTALDAWLCDLKEAQIRDGLHVFGASPMGDLRRDLAIALARLPRGDGKGANASLIRALARDCGCPAEFDPLDCDMAAPWKGPRHPALAALGPDPWRTAGDTVERLELMAQRLVDGAELPDGFARTEAVLETLRATILPAIDACGPREGEGLLRALEGRFLAPGPSGAPTRGRPEVLPTGRNFYSVDTRAVPSPAAWTLGWASAERLVERHLQEEGDWPRALLITAWGTACMRTGGDDIAQALALMGVRPTWDATSRRVTGFEILPLSVLARPRVDVTLRVSGFFRDAFPGLIDLFDSAARAVMALEELEADNPAAARFRAETHAGGETARRAGFRVFGAKPGAYGAGLQALIDERLWQARADLGHAWLDWGGYAYGDGAEGLRARDLLEARMTRVDAIVQNQDNREHDILDSDDYYQFEGGAAAAVEALQGRARPVWHMDHSRPERPVARSLAEEISRVIRSRAVNPKWIASCRRHGYKGAFEMAATLDYLFAFAATTRAVQSHHFDLIEAAYIEDDKTRGFIEDANPAALREMAERLQEAIERGLWQPRSNSARARIAGLLEGTA
ncbi:MAG: cobaltochelatase subunit CobN [Alphaproteobacteria bacterium]|nr:MAG: cobaltochelatase subunit CobN [Alphaproteobacteria bacterium]